MIPVIVAAAGPTAGRPVTAAVQLAPVAVAAGAGAFAAHRLTGAAADAVPLEDLPRREHGAAAAGVLAPLPALAGAGFVLAAASKRAGLTRTVELPLRSVETGLVERFTQDVRRGWTLGPRLLRAGSFGAIAGAVTAAGLAVPVATFGAGLVGRGTDATVRAVLPDWIEGPARTLPVLPADAARAVAEASSHVLDDGGQPQERYRTSHHIDPARGFDPMRDLGLGAPGADVTTSSGDTDAVARRIVLDRIEAAAGSPAERVE